ncbi:SRPBCC family protein [Nocardia yamanashiensis]|uniref:SRPBCC family protein n=1 Tax=Nocardia yamanashiensis TaxID=209247 RepID=UPI001E2E4793|nr:SRPBCC family protein [Nocardia yamanashiensis]UGT40992.1 SRPBCC family protein [Nocardia yamanashiensis]
MTTRLSAQTEIARPAAAVWALLADYGNDPKWREGVRTMAPDPEGPVKVGTRTAEQLRFAGRTYRNDGEVVAVEQGVRFEWRTTSGVDATGTRTVTPLGADRCEVRLETLLRPRGADRVVALLFGGPLQRNLRRDLHRLRDLAESGGPHDQ